MAPFVPLFYGAQVEIVHELDGQILSNRLWFTFDTLFFDVTDLQGLTDGVAAWWVGNVLPFLSHDLITAAVIAKDWTADPPPADAVTVVNVAGAVASESLSANVAVVVPFSWPLGIRLKKNKHFVPGVPEEYVDLNTTNATIRDGLYEAYSALIDAARLFSPILHWRWVATSSWEAGVLREEQKYYDVQGTRLDRAFVLGQRRKRLPP